MYKIKTQTSIKICPMEKVESNDDLLMSVLVRLPPKSVFRFRCVSKRWNNIVAGPIFNRSYYETRKRELEHQISNSKSSIMNFIQTKTYITLSRECLFLKGRSRSDVSWRFRNNIYAVSSSSSKDHQYSSKIRVPKKFGFLLQSINGLILCGRHPDRYHVLNPFAKTCVSLPPPPRIKEEEEEEEESLASIGLVCQEPENSTSSRSRSNSNFNLVPNFKVVRVCASLPYGVLSKFLQIQTYSSNTREWTHSILVGTGEFRIHPSKWVVSVFNGALHWLTLDINLAVYDSSSSSSDECDNHVQLIILPSDNDFKKFGLNVTRDDDGVLWCCTNNGKTKRLQLWMLPKDNGGGGGYKRSSTIPEEEWVLMHTITHEYFMPLVIKHGINIPAAIITAHEEYLFIQLLWLVPLVNKAVFSAGGFVICIYNFETKSVESSFPIGHEFSWDNLSLYMEPLSLSSYALSAKAYDDDDDHHD